MAARTASASRTGSWPPTRTEPPSGRLSVHRMSTIVVLPAPLGPRRAKTDPSGTDRSMPSRTTWSPKDLRSPLVEMAAGLDPDMALLSVGGGGTEVLVRGEGWSSAADDDVAVGGAGPDPQRFVGLCGLVGGVARGEQVPHLPGRRLEVQPRGRALGDAGLDLAVGGGEVQRSAGGGVDAHLAVLGRRRDRGERVLHGDVPAGAVQAQGAGRLADPDLAVGGAGLAVLVDLAHRDVAGRRAGVQGRRPVDPDVAVAVVDADVAEPALAVDVAGDQGRVEARALRDQDLDVDRRSGAEEQQAGTARRGDDQPPVAERDARLLDGLDVGGAGRVAGADGDHRVGAGAGADQQRAAGEVDADGDGGGGVERRHGGGPRERERGHRGLPDPAGVLLAVLAA